MGSSACSSRNVVNFSRDQDTKGQKFSQMYKINKKGLDQGLYITTGEVESKSNPDKKYKVKIIEKRHMEQERFDTIKKELEVLCSIDHPNIITYQVFCEDKKKLYIVTEIPKGTTLQSQVKDKLRKFTGKDFSNFYYN